MGSDQSSQKTVSENPTYNPASSTAAGETRNATATKPTGSSGMATDATGTRGGGVASGPEPAGAQHNIVVVREAARVNVDDELSKLELIPTFFPIMRGTLNIPNIEERAPKSLERLDAKQMLSLCVRLQEHLRQCAEAVSFDQNVLTGRIKEVEHVISLLLSHLSEKQKRFAKYAEQIHKVEEMSSLLKKCQRNMDEILPLMEKLNDQLPEDQRLEPFQV